MYKLKKLEDILRKMDSVLVAYSGGVDSTFLLKVTRGILGDKVLAVTAYSSTYPDAELESAKKMARTLGVRHRIIQTQELEDKRFISNPINRCYFCKRELFGRLKNIAKKSKLNFVVDATNVSDKKDYRPGNIAKKEFNVRSPLQEAKFTKEDIRNLSKKLGLITWDKPSLACLASRIPYGTKISLKMLGRIQKAETFLKQIGFQEARLRHYNGLCRIEVPKGDILSLISKRDKIINRLKKIGYNYITVDLEGFRTGSMNEVLGKRKR